MRILLMRLNYMIEILVLNLLYKISNYPLLKGLNSNEKWKAVSRKINDCGIISKRLENL